MDEDDQRAKRIASYVIGQDLAELSVEEIGETIEALNLEIERLKSAKNEKSDHMSAAEALFKN